MASCKAVSSSSSSSASSTSSTAIKSGFAGNNLSGFLASSLSNSTVYRCKEKSQPLITPPLPLRSDRDFSSCKITFVPSGNRPPLSGRMWMTLRSAPIAARNNSWPRRSKMSMYKRCKLSTNFPNSSSCTGLNLPTAIPDLMSSNSFTAPCSTSDARTSKPRQGLSLCCSNDVIAQCICLTAVRVFRRWRCTVFGFSCRNSNSFGSSNMVKAPPAAFVETFGSNKMGLTLSRKLSAYFGLLSKICCAVMPRRSFSSSASSSLEEMSPKRLNWCAVLRASPRMLRPSWSFCWTVQPVSDALCNTIARSSPIFRRSRPSSSALLKATACPCAAQPPEPAMP
mmetsp:Transcript_108038/g.312188  ORF Transcript_108038/g.312188 Transcript_108038/m.312188 type:complete len:339 (-) Transcript_108038:473-1489(-)